MLKTVNENSLDLQKECLETVSRKYDGGTIIHVPLTPFAYSQKSMKAESAMLFGQQATRGASPFFIEIPGYERLQGSVDWVDGRPCIDMMCEKGNLQDVISTHREDIHTALTDIIPKKWSHIVEQTVQWYGKGFPKINLSRNVISFTGKGPYTVAQANIIADVKCLCDRDAFSIMALHKELNRNSGILDIENAPVEFFRDIQDIVEMYLETKGQMSDRALTAKLVVAAAVGETLNPFEGINGLGVLGLPDFTHDAPEHPETLGKMDEILHDKAVDFLFSDGEDKEMLELFGGFMRDKFLNTLSTVLGMDSATPDVIRIISIYATIGHDGANYLFRNLRGPLRLSYGNKDDVECQVGHFSSARELSERNNDNFKDILRKAVLSSAFPYYDTDTANKIGNQNPDVILGNIRENARNLVESNQIPDKDPKYLSVEVARIAVFSIMNIENIIKSSVDKKTPDAPGYS